MLLCTENRSSISLSVSACLTSSQMKTSVSYTALSEISMYLVLIASSHYRQEINDRLRDIPAALMPSTSRQTRGTGATSGLWMASCLTTMLQ